MAVPKQAPPAEGQTWVDQSLGGSNPDDMIAVVPPGGGPGGTVRRADLDEAIAHGFRLESPEESHKRDLEREYGDHPIEAAAESALSTATFGLSRYINPERQRGIEEHNETASLVGGVAGAFIPTGGGALLSGAGKLAGGLIKGEGLLARAAGAGIGGVVEGAGYGLGAGIGQVALSEDPMTWEGATAIIGSNVLGGAVLGGGIGIGGKLLAEGATVAKAYANKTVEKIAAGAEGAVDRAAFPEIAAYDAETTAAQVVKERHAVKAQKATNIAETDAAIAKEEADLVVGQTADAGKALEEAKQYKTLTQKNFIPSEGEEAAALGASTAKIRTGLKNETKFIKTRGANSAFENGLQEQETVLKKILSNKDEILAQAEAKHQALLDSLPKEIPKPERYYTGEIELPGATGAAEAGAIDSSLPFHERVIEAARSVPAKQRMGQKALIADVWEHAGMKGEMTYEEFQNALRVERRAGRVDLARADFPEGLNQNRVDISGMPNVVDNPAVGESHFVNFEHAPVREVPASASAVAPVVEEVASTAKVYLTPEQSTIYRDWAGLKQKKAPKAMAIGADELSAFRQAVEDGTVQALPVTRVQRAEALLEANQGMKERLQRLQAKPTSEKLAGLQTKLKQVTSDATPTPRLAALEAHAADLQKKSIGRTIAQGIGGSIGGALGSAIAGPVVGGIGGAFIGRDVGNKIYDRFIRKIVSGNASRAQTIKSTIASMFAKGAGKVAKAAPQMTKIIPAIQYATKEHADQVLGPERVKPARSEMVTQFRQRARELNSVTERAPDGSMKVRHQAIMDLHDRVTALWAIAPGVANGVEKTQIAKLQYLASKLPRNPSPPHLQAGPDNWEPPQAEIARFGRIMHAAEHPEEPVKRLAEGTATPDDAETLRAVWPSHYEDVRQQCMAHVATLQQTLPYVQRLNLSILLDIDVDPALTPEAMSVYQAPQPEPEQQGKPAQQKNLPMGMVEPTQAQRMSSK